MSLFEWTSDTGQPRSGYSDQVRIKFRFIEDLLTTEPVEDWIVASNGSAWEEDWLILEVENIVRLGYQNEDGGWIHGGPLYDATITRRRVNWGADASFFTILIDLGVGLLGAAAWDSLKTLGSRMADRLRQRDNMSPRPLTEDEAFERARWLLSERYEKSTDTLHLVSVESTDEAVSIVINDADGVTYSCTLVVIDGLVDIARVRRELPR